MTRTITVRMLVAFAGLALAQLLSGMARPPRNANGRIDVDPLFVLSLLGIALRKDLFDRAFSLWIVFVTIAWAFFARLTG